MIHLHCDILCCRSEPISRDSSHFSALNRVKSRLESASCVILAVVGILLICFLWSFVSFVWLFSRVCPFFSLEVRLFESTLEKWLWKACVAWNSKQDKRKLSIIVVKQLLCHRKCSCNFYVISQHDRIDFWPLRHVDDQLTLFMFLLKITNKQWSLSWEDLAI